MVVRDYNIRATDYPRTIGNSDESTTIIRSNDVAQIVDDFAVRIVDDAAVWVIIGDSLIRLTDVRSCRRCSNRKLGLRNSCYISRRSIPNCGLTLYHKL